MPSHRFHLVALIAALAIVSTAYADDGQPAFKFTAGLYHFASSGNGVDLNVRHSSSLGNVWAGVFRAPALDAQQWRVGWDRSIGEQIRWQPSIQFASGGFAGASLNVETGERWVFGAGLGRTNLRPYFNLNFDPNDAWSLLAGYRGESGSSLVASYVRDNRENPDQQHVHLTARLPRPQHQRLTLDLLYKRGLVDNHRIARFGATATYDWPTWFVRLAYDPYTNFTPSNAWRLSIGTRF